MRTRLLMAVAASLLARVGVAQSADDLASLGTTFDTPAAIEPWSRLEVPGWASKWASARVERGAFVVVPKSSGWYEDNYGGYLFREVEGDFVATTRVSAAGVRSRLPTHSFSLAGLLVRAPRELDAERWGRGQENWLFLSVGVADDQGRDGFQAPATPQFEVKTTVNSRSTLTIHDAPASDVELRIARFGEYFLLLYRDPAAASPQWRQIAHFQRADLPPRVQVGLTAYADWDSVAAVYPDYERYNRQGPPRNNADLVARFDHIAFRRPAKIATAEEALAEATWD